jgi:hypothetical protein
MLPWKGQCLMFFDIIKFVRVYKNSFCIPLCSKLEHRKIVLVRHFLVHEGGK